MSAARFRLGAAAAAFLSVLSLSGIVPADAQLDDSRMLLASLVVAVEDEEPPRILSLFASPSIVPRGFKVHFFLHATDASGVQSATLDLAALGLDTVSFTPIDSQRTRWLASARIPLQASPGIFRLMVHVRDTVGNRTDTTVGLTVRRFTSHFCRFLTPRRENGDGIRIAGNIISLLAEPLRPNLSGIRFEYRPFGADHWQACADAMGMTETGPWSAACETNRGSLIWDISALAPGDYEVRALGQTGDGASDSEPEVMRLVRDSATGEITEWFDARSYTKVNVFNGDETETGALFDGTLLVLPPSAIPGLDTLAVRMVFFTGAPAEAPAPGAGSGLVATGIWRRLERLDGLSSFADDVLVGIPYTPGLLGISEDRIGLYHFNPVAGLWVREEHCWLDRERHLVWARVRHFTDFAVLGNLARASLAGVVVYPNPFIPCDGDATTGRPFVRGDNTTGILFANVTSTVDIDVYSVAGRRVATIHAANTGGTVQWDARGDNGDELASGMYIAVLRSPSGESVNRKIMIIR